jgi:A/G-specific adenine glycosylase
LNGIVSFLIRFRYNYHPMNDYDKFPRLVAREGVTERTIRRFRAMVYNHYAANPRPLPWRETGNPYHILVSEIMLQQTRVERVLEKYRLFLAAFPDFDSLSRAPLQEVLGAWQGLGYNRRAISLKETARHVVERFAGTLPESPESLKTLPGIGDYTAAAIAAFAFYRPVPLIETNIRTVFIHCFFHDREGVRDSEIRPLVEATLDSGNPREWYYALMDFGVMLKRQMQNPSRRSAHHTRQSPFEGSDRQIRGKILRILLEEPSSSSGKIVGLIGGDPERIARILEQLEKERFIIQRRRRYSIAE